MNRKKAIQYLINKNGIPLPGMKRLLTKIATERVSKIHNYLAIRSDRTEKLCTNCGDKYGKKSLSRYVYHTPWEEKPHKKSFCSEDCEESYLHGGDFEYFFCNFCQREICEQNPSNGWHTQFRTLDGEQVCLKCYEEYILKNGVSRDEILSGRLPGMFFSWGNSEPKDKGYEEIYLNLFIRSKDSVNDATKKILALMDQGKKVVIAYENMGIGGSEGTISIFAKEGGDKDGSK